MRVCACVCVRALAYACMRSFECVCVRACVRACVRVCAWVLTCPKARDTTDTYAPVPHYDEQVPLGLGE